MQRIFKGGVYSREAFKYCKPRSSCTGNILGCYHRIAHRRSFRERAISSKGMKYSHFELNNNTIETNKYLPLVFVFKDKYLNCFHWLQINALKKGLNVKKDCGIYLRVWHLFE